jgi:hypothetical protein
VAETFEAEDKEKGGGRASKACPTEMTWRASNALNLASRGLGLQTGQYTSKAKRRLSEASYLADGQIPPIDLQATQRVKCSILDKQPLR